MNVCCWFEKKLLNGCVEIMIWWLIWYGGLRLFVCNLVWLLIVIIVSLIVVLFVMVMLSRWLRFLLRLCLNIILLNFCIWKMVCCWFIGRFIIGCIWILWNRWKLFVLCFLRMVIVFLWLKVLIRCLVFCWFILLNMISNWNVICWYLFDLWFVDVKKGFEGFEGERWWFWFFLKFCL